MEKIVTKNKKYFFIFKISISLHELNECVFITKNMLFSVYLIEIHYFAAS